MNRRTFILFSSLLTTTILAAEANPFKTIEELENFLPHIKKYESIPSPRTFYAESSRTAAGVLHYAIDENGKAVILLGLRRDQETWCNFGGMSDQKENQDLKQEKTLSETASREVTEESNGYYAHHPYDLENLPFIDILRGRENKGSLLYRMYWKKVKKVPGEILLNALETSQESHSKEYKNFMWVPVEAILASLKKKKTTLKVAEGQKIELFEPLFRSLSTDSGIDFLESILKVKDHTIPRFHKKKNRLFVIEEPKIKENYFTIEDNSSTIENNTSQHGVFNVHWQLPKIRHTLRKTITELVGNKEIKRYDVPYVPFGTNAWGEKKQTFTLGKNKYSAEVPFSVEKDEKDFAYAVAAHGAAMIELKRKAKDIQQKAEIYEEEKSSLIEEEWNSHSELSLSRIHLRLVLGEDFKIPEDFPQELKPQRAADIANLRAYLTEHKDVEFDQKKVKVEFKREINFTEKDLEIFADILEWEAQNQHSPSFYHAANADLNNLWKSLTHLRELLSLSPLVGQKVVLRGTDIYFRGIKTMGDILEKYGKHDYENGKENLVLCANFVLTAGPKTSRSTSSSLEYFLNNHSVKSVNIEEKFSEATILGGILGEYAYFRSPFLQFLAHLGSQFENSVLLGASIPSYLLSDHTCLDHSKEGTTLSILKGIQNEYETHKEKQELFTERTEEKRALFPEARLSLHPEFILNKDVYIKSFNRFPLSDLEQNLFEYEMRQATLGTLADWLRSHFEVVPDSFVDSPRLKKLYHMAYQAITGEKIKENFTEKAFFYLLANNHVSGVKEFVKAVPEIVNHEKCDPMTLTYAALRENNHEMLKCFFEDLFKEKLQDFFKTPKEFGKVLRTCLLHKAAGSLDYILSQSSFKETLPEKWRQICVNYILSDPDEKIIGVFLKYFPQQSSEVLKRSFEEKPNLDIEALISSGISPQVVVEGLLTDQFFDLCIINSFFNVLRKHQINLSNVKDVSGLLNDIYLSSEELDLLVKNGMSPQKIAEGLLNKKPLNEQTFFSFFNLIEKYKVNLSNIEEIDSILNSECFSSEKLDLFVKNGILPQKIAEGLLNKKPLNEQTFFSFFNLIEKYKVNLSNIEEIGIIVNNRYIISSEELDLLVKNGMSPQKIAEGLLNKKPLSEQTFFLFFNLIKNHKIDLSNIEDIRSIFNSEYFSSEELDLLVKNGMSPQKIAEGLLNKKPLSTKMFSLFYDLIKNYKINLSNIEDIHSFFYEDDLSEEMCIKIGISHEGFKNSMHKSGSLSSPSNIAVVGENCDALTLIKDCSFNEQLNFNELEKPLSLNNPEILKENLFQKLPNDYDVTLEWLKKTCPNVDDFNKLQHHSFLNWSNDQTLLAIYDYFGDRFPEFARAINRSNFKNLLRNLPPEKTKDLIEKYPTLFVEKGKKDFFTLIITSVPLEVQEILLTKYTDTFSKKSKEFGIPYIFLLFNSTTCLPFNTFFMDNEVRGKTSEGISIEEYVQDVLGLKTYFTD